MRPLVDASIHRFHDRVAVSLPGNGETVYLEPKEARRLAKALLEGAQSIERQTFTDSTFVTRQVSINGNHLFKQVRK